jgi:hypothetical protein
MQENHTRVEKAILAVADGQSNNKVAAHWAQKLANRKSQKYAFLDSGEHPEQPWRKTNKNFNDAGKISRKTFMFPNGRTGKATKKMLLKHNMQIAAQEMNILPGLHSALVSVPKLADAGYTMELMKDGAAIYNDNTTAITASNPPILESDRCQHTGMWRLNLDPENPNLHNPNKQHETPKTINLIFNLPSLCKTFLWYHASVGFPPKETFIDADCNGYYATWQKLMVTLINRYFSNWNETVKGHLKGQYQGI